MKTKEQIESLIKVHESRIKSANNILCLSSGTQKEFIKLAIEKEKEIIDILKWILDEND
ncbi:Uncharacterised protein [Acinetobacter phage MD-2021a]|nr:Uncharacterised protein [Acinetobacter phage MD-2021a]